MRTLLTASGLHLPRYFFDIHDGIEVKDHTGRDLPGIRVAQGEAMRIASDFAARPQMLDDKGGAIVIDIRDAPNRIVCTIRLVFQIGSG